MRNAQYQCDIQFKLLGNDTLSVYRVISGVCELIVRDDSGDFDAWLQASKDESDECMNVVLKHMQAHINMLDSAIQTCRSSN